jgi:hypothetical protein
MAKREKPKLHLIRSGGPEVYCADLDWFFGCFEYEAGLRSQPLERIDYDTGNMRRTVTATQDSDGFEFDPSTGAAMLDVKAKNQMVRDPSCTTPWSDWHVNFGKSGAFTRARKIWQRFSRLRWSEQEMLRRYYEPRQYFPPELKPIPDAIVHALHRSYYGLEAA